MGLVNPGILFFCGTGYSFDEVFYPVIKEMRGFCRMSLLLGDSYLNGSVKVKLDELIDNNILEKCRIIQPDFEEGESLKAYHQRLSALADSLQDFDVGMFVMCTDYPVFSRYMLSPFLDRRIKIPVRISAVKAGLFQKLHFLLPRQKRNFTSA